MDKGEGSSGTEPAGTVHNGNGARTTQRGHFFMTPNAYVDEFLPRLRSIAAVKAYEYLRRHNFACGGIVEESLVKIARAIGHKKAVASRGMLELVELGLVVVARPGRRGKPTAYKVADPLPAVGLFTELGHSLGPASPKGKVTRGTRIGLPKGPTLVTQEDHIGCSTGPALNKTEDLENKNTSAAAQRAADAAPAGNSRRKVMKGERVEKSDTRHQALVKHFCDRWRDRWNAKYPFNGGKDGAHIRWILDQVDRNLERAKQIVDDYLSSEDPYLVDHRHGFGLLKSQFHKFVARDDSSRRSSQTPRSPHGNGNGNAVRTYHEPVGSLPVVRFGGKVERVQDAGCGGGEGSPGTRG